MLKGNDNRFYLHEVVDDNGNLIYIREEPHETIKTVESAQDGVHGDSWSSSDITVPQAAQVVNPDAAIPPGSVTPGGTEAAQASGTSSQDGTTTAATSGTDTDQTAEVSPEPIPPRQQEPENGKCSPGGFRQIDSA